MEAWASPDHMPSCRTQKHQLLWHQGPHPHCPLVNSMREPVPSPGRERVPRKEMGEQTVTYIGTFGARETHDTRLPASPLRTWRSRTTIFTRGSLRERTPFSEQIL